ncbi:hypothetical protein BABINDRAFT_162665 [Babjeviella inositovora NRRL Y-12698]|uniref:Uncharacterized protein n=1 Tax=Babjeviella inositovora NRRL Y-12698 TaxID=984486 RepID=A0A1E3QMX4_9ASCO|nr:uncharacterized protein BABINDRAFT_162665 [Babjeviella inositovora NRRL Y-12698]ODQ78442.1 hypothetical protein BABINDRAFT_162665 [Babjeviella inositovora NRRL Y-12698]
MHQTQFLLSPYVCHFTSPTHLLDPPSWCWKLPPLLYFVPPFTCRAGKREHADEKFMGKDFFS